MTTIEKARTIGASAPTLQGKDSASGKEQLLDLTAQLLIKHSREAIHGPRDDLLEPGRIGVAEAPPMLLASGNREELAQDVVCSQLVPGHHFDESIAL